MGSTFGGIVQAGSGLTAASYGLQVVAQNIDNADTDGYTRRTSQQAAADGVAGVPTIYTSQAGMAGVRVVSTDRMNDLVLDQRSRLESSRSANYDTAAAQLAQVEDIFPEPADSGLGGLLNDFWNSFASLANDPGPDTAPRSVVLGTAQSVADTLNTLSGTLASAADSVAQSLDLTTSSANSELTSLYELNKQIAIGYRSNQDINNLLDQRDMLVDKLASQVGSIATFNWDQTVSISVGGATAATATKLLDWQAGGQNPLTPTVSKLNALYVDPSTHDVSVNITPYAAATLTAVTLTGGSALANVTFLQSTYPDYNDQLDDVARSLATLANEALTDSGSNPAYDLDGNPGGPLFSDGSAGYTASTITAANISLAISDPRAIAASSIAPDPGPPVVANLDGANALRISSFGTLKNAPDKVYNDLVGDVGQRSLNSQSARATQDAVTQSVQNLRRAASGVSTDEEVSNMLTYQRAYEAASRVLTAMDSLLDTLINHTGAG